MNQLSYRLVIGQEKHIQFLPDYESVGSILDAYDYESVPHACFCQTRSGLVN